MARNSPRNAYWAVTLAALVAGAAGCSPIFNVRAAHEVSRDRLLELADQGRTNHLRYMGSDGAYHYVYDTRQGHERSYKIRSDEVNLKDTFYLGDDDEPYVLWPWVIEGSLMGSAPQELPETAFAAEPLATETGAAGESAPQQSTGWHKPVVPAVSQRDAPQDQ